MPTKELTMAESIDLKLNIDTSAAEELKQIPKDVAQGFARLNQEMGTLQGPRGDLAKEYAKRMREVSETAAGQGFFTPQQAREFQRSSRGLGRVFDQHYREMIQAAKGGAAKFEKELQDIGDRLAKAQGSEKAALTKQMGQMYQQYQHYLATGGASNLGPIIGARQGTTQNIQGIQAQQQLAALLNPPPGQPLAQPPGQQPDQGGGMGWLAGAGKFARGLVGAYSVYAIAGKIRRDFEGELERTIAVADMGQRVRPVGMSGGQFQGIAKQLESSLRPEESTRFLQRYTELTGNKLPAAGEAVGLTRALGFAPEEGAQRFGQASRMGMEQDRFAKKIAEETARANMQGRQGEMFDSLTQMADELTQRLGRVPDQDAIASMLGRLSAQGVPGLQGSYGASTVQGIDAAFRGQQLFQLPDMGAITMFSMFAKKGITDPALMERIKNEGLIAHPEMWKPFFQTFDEHGGLNSLLGVKMAETFNFPTTPEAFNATRKALTSDEAPDYMKFLQKVLGPEEASKLSLAKTPQMFAVAKQFQAREAAGGFVSPEEERKQLIAALEKEGAAMLDELGTRQAMAKAGQAWTDVIDLGVNAFTHLVNTTLPAFDHALLDAAEFLDNLNPFSTKPSAANLEKLPPDVTRKIGAATAKQAKIPSTVGATGIVDALQGADISGSPMVPKGTTAFSQFFKSAATATGVDQKMLEALGFGESGFNPKAVSHKGARGIMQIMPGNKGPFPGASLADLDNPAKNIAMGSEHFARLLRKYRGNEDLAVAAYNRGEGNVPVGSDIDDVLNKADAAGFTETRRLVEQYHQYLSGHATVYVRSEKTGELLGHTKVPMMPHPGISGLSTDSPLAERKVR